tara:strand:+ start:82 stop:882 length:801 start_codon:yes stop_codon:yes gene_type:complete
MKIRVILLVYLFSLFARSSHGIVIRHDVAPGAYSLRSNDFPQVFFLERQGMRKVCGATLISDRWALTAAHCVGETSLGSVIQRGEEFQVEIANTERSIDRVVSHPNFLSSSTPEIDLALLRFSEEVDSPQPIPLNTQPNELGETITLVGWGYFGLGTTGRQYDDGTKRQAENRISHAGQQLRALFDDPRLSGSTALPLEGTLSLGDSGGPAFLEAPEGLLIAGVSVGQIEGPRFSEETQGQYGSIAVFERLSLHIEWINSVINSDY